MDNNISNFINTKPQTLQKEQKTTQNAQTSLENNNNKQNASTAKATTQATVNYKDEFVKEKKKTGLVERFCNLCKKITGGGVGTKKVENTIDKLNKGQVTEQELKDKISEYKISKENTAQNFGNILSGVTSISGFFAIMRLQKQYKASSEIGGNFIQNFMKEFFGSGSKYSSIIKNFDKTMKSTKRTTFVAIP